MRLPKSPISGARGSFPYSPRGLLVVLYPRRRSKPESLCAQASCTTVRAFFRKSHSYFLLGGWENNSPTGISREQNATICRKPPRADPFFSDIPSMRRSSVFCHSHVHTSPVALFLHCFLVTHPLPCVLLSDKLVYISTRRDASACAEFPSLVKLTQSPVRRKQKYRRTIENTACSKPLRRTKGRIPLPSKGSRPSEHYSVLAGDDILIGNDYFRWAIFRGGDVNPCHD